MGILEIGKVLSVESRLERVHDHNRSHVVNPKIVIISVTDCFYSINKFLFRLGKVHLPASRQAVKFQKVTIDHFNDIPYAFFFSFDHLLFDESHEVEQNNDGDKSDTYNGYRNDFG